MNEFIPPVSVDIELGRYFRDIGINYDALVEYMRSRGFDDLAIEQITVHIKADNTLFRNEEGTVCCINGTYNMDSGAVALYPFRLAFILNRLAAKATTSEELEALERKISRIGSEEYSAVLAHELSHAERNPPTGTESNDTPHNFNSRSLARIAMRRIDNGYGDDPEELASREAEKNAPKDLLYLQMRARPRS